jgi:hypothetical protein
VETNAKKVSCLVFQKRREDTQIGQNHKLVRGGGVCRGLGFLHLLINNGKGS